MVAYAFQVLVLIGYIILGKKYVTTWPGWSIECLLNWRIYLKIGIFGVGMTVLEWAFFEIGVILASKINPSVFNINPNKLLMRETINFSYIRFNRQT